MGKINILYLETYADIAGGQRGLLDLIDALDRNRFNPVVVCPREGLLSQALKERHIPFHFVDLRKRRRKDFMRFIPPITGLTRMLRLISRDNISIIHANGYYDSIYSGLVARLAKIPSLCTVRNVYVDIPFAFLRHKILCSLNAALYTNSFRAKEVISNYVRGGNVATIHTGIDIERFDPNNPNALRIRRELGIPLKATVISQISQLSPQKGHIHLINASSQVIEQDENVHFLFVGGGFGKNNNKTYLEEQIGKRGLTHWFTFTGFRNDVEDILSATDITVLPSVKGEGLPRAILESMAMQRPVIASDLAGIKEIIDDGINGYTVKPGNELEIVDRLVGLVRNGKRRNEMGIAARHKIENEFALTSMVEKYQNVYEDLVGSTSDGV